MSQETKRKKNQPDQHRVPHAVRTCGFAFFAACAMAAGVGCFWALAVLDKPLAGAAMFGFVLLTSPITAALCGVDTRFALATTQQLQPLVATLATVRQLARHRKATRDGRQLGP